MKEPGRGEQDGLEWPEWKLRCATFMSHAPPGREKNGYLSAAISAARTSMYQYTHWLLPRPASHPCCSYLAIPLLSSKPLLLLLAYLVIPQLLPTDNTIWPENLQLLKGATT